jgi:hypothetical protein
LDDVGGPDPDGGLPDSAPEPDPVPMFGQFFVEPDPELELEPEFELEPEPELVDELDEPDPEFPAPVVPEPVLPVFELDDGVLVDDVVAALATSAPPATRPDVKAPTARTFRRRICMCVCPFLWVQHRLVRTGTAPRCAPDLCAAAGRGRRVRRVP